MSVLSYDEEQRERMLAFTAASHPRLGLISPAHGLTHELYGVVARTVLPPRYIPSFHSLSDLSHSDLMQGTLPSEAVYTNLRDNGASVIELEISSPTLQAVLWKGRMPMSKRETNTEHEEFGQDLEPGYFLYIKEHSHKIPPPSNIEKLYDVMLLFYLPYPPSNQIPHLKIETIICSASMIREMMEGFRKKTFRFPGTFFDFTGRVGQRSSHMIFFREPCTTPKGEIFDVSFPAASLHLRVDPGQNFSPNTTPQSFSSPFFPL